MKIRSAFYAWTLGFVLLGLPATLSPAWAQAPTPTPVLSVAEGNQNIDLTSTSCMVSGGAVEYKFDATLSDGTVNTICAGSDWQSSTRFFSRSEVYTQCNFQVTCRNAETLEESAASNQITTSWGPPIPNPAEWVGNPNPQGSSSMKVLPQVSTDLHDAGNGKTFRCTSTTDGTLTEDAIRYRIQYRKQGSKFWITFPSDAAFCNGGADPIVTGLDPSTTYEFRFRTRDASFNFGDFSAVVTGTTGTASAFDFYVDCNNGDDTNTGTTPETAWRDLDNAYDIMPQDRDYTIGARGDCRSITSVDRTNTVTISAIDPMDPIRFAGENRIIFASDGDQMGLVLDGFEMVGTSATSSSATCLVEALFDGSGGITLKNGTIRGLDPATTPDGDLISTCAFRGQKGGGHNVHIGTADGPMTIKWMGRDVIHWVSDTTRGAATVGSVVNTVIEDFHESAILFRNVDMDAQVFDVRISRQWPCGFDVTESCNPTDHGSGIGINNWSSSQAIAQDHQSFEFHGVHIQDAGSTGPVYMYSTVPAAGFCQMSDIFVDGGNNFQIRDTCTVLNTTLVNINGVLLKIKTGETITWSNNVFDGTVSFRANAEEGEGACAAGVITAEKNIYRDVHALDSNGNLTACHGVSVNPGNSDLVGDSHFDDGGGRGCAMFATCPVEPVNWTINLGNDGCCWDSSQTFSDALAVGSPAIDFADTPSLVADNGESPAAFVDRDNDTRPNTAGQDESGSQTE